TGVARCFELVFCRGCDEDAEADPQPAAAVLSRDDQDDPRSLASSGDKIHSCSLGIEPLGPGGADPYVCSRPGARGDTANVPRDPHNTDSARQQVTRLAGLWLGQGSRTTTRIKSPDSKFYINYVVSGDSGLFRGSRLTVGCPVVVSPLRCEWSCLYRRCEAPDSFLTSSKEFVYLPDPLHLPTRYPAILTPLLSTRTFASWLPIGTALPP